MKETNRISALKRLTKPISSNNSIHSRLSAPDTTPVITDARQLLTNRNKPIFDARQLLSRQSSKTRDTSLTIRNDMEDDDEEEEEEQPDDKSKPLFITRSKDGRLTTGTVNRSAPGNIRNSQLVEPISFKKTISNAPASSDQKVVISFVNDQYRKRQRTPSPLAHSPPPIIRRLNDASIQTAHLSSSSRAPLRTNTQRKYLDDQYEPATKRISSRNTITNRDQQVSSSSKNSLKHISTDTSVSTRPKPKLNSDEATVLITNLQTSVTEDDVIELFSQVGDIEDIKTLSHGCVQIIYAKHEQAEEAVAKYHNRLLDGKLMYVCLQQPTSYSTKSSKSTTGKDKNASSSSSSNNNESFHSNSNKMAIDPAFFRQALFNPSTSTSNNVQFQVKL